MSEATVNGIRLHYESVGSGDPLVLIHGAWSDATTWEFVLPELAQRFRVLTYDRRGYSRSERPRSPWSVDDDGGDLAALLETLALAPVHVATSSYGGNVALRLAARRSELFRTLSCHEPPLFGVLDDRESEEALARLAPILAAVGRRIAEGDHEGAARHFTEEIMLGPGAWEEGLRAEVKARMVANAPPFLVQLQDPDTSSVDREALTRLHVPVRLTVGTESPSIHARVVDRLLRLLPDATREVIDGEGHIPHITNPLRYVGTVAHDRRAETTSANVIAHGRPTT